MPVAGEEAAAPGRGPAVPAPALTVRNRWISGTRVDKACVRINGGSPPDVLSGGGLTLQAPLVVLTDGFAVKTGGTFTVDSTLP